MFDMLIVGKSEITKDKGHKNYPSYHRMVGRFHPDLSPVHLLPPSVACFFRKQATKLGIKLTSDASHYSLSPGEPPTVSYVCSHVTGVTGCFYFITLYW